MRPLSLALAASLLLLASNAGAQSGSYPATGTTPSSTVQVTAPAPGFQFWEYQAEWISGAYAMSNGWRLKVDPSSTGIVAQIDKQRPMKLIALSEDKFVSRDGNVSMEFNRGAQGDEMLMSYVPDDPSLAHQVIVVKATMAQR
ncbi:hypothetical protein [Massilia niastensis]|uniref:hypothetical protein n=1 Tax=Massilia niastensis TaxID=544911 RepID=UPI0003750414|nr:hypothetical protein [Massilia niastensis]